MISVIEPAQEMDAVAEKKSIRNRALFIEDSEDSKIYFRFVGSHSLSF